MAEWEKKLDDIVLMDQSPYKRELNSSQIIEQIIYRTLLIIKNKLDKIDYYRIDIKENDDNGIMLTVGIRNASNYRFKITFNPTEDFDAITVTIQFSNNKDLITKRVPINEITQDYVGNLFLKILEQPVLQGLSV